MVRYALRLLMACASVVFCGTSCKEKIHPTGTDTVETVIISDSLEADSLEELISEEPISKAVDELFDDFFFNFAGNRKMQMKRICFPLTVIENGQKRKVSKGQWKMERFFMPQGFYTLILDNRKQLELSKDTSIHHVVVEKILLEEKRVKKYNFDRRNGCWMLTSVDDDGIINHHNASFLTFYERFATDSAFRMQSLHNPILFTGPDPDDDFNMLTGEISPEQWPVVGPGELPQKELYNIIYGQQYTGSRQKIFLIRGVANGLEVELTFNYNEEKWELTALTE